MKDDAKFEEWMTTVHAYENKKNGDSIDSVAGILRPDSTHGPLATISREQSESLLRNVHVQNLWPKDVYLASDLKKKAEQPVFEQGDDAFGDSGRWTRC